MGHGDVLILADTNFPADSVARAGGEVHLITRLGRDAFADIARATWAPAGVQAVVTEDAESYTGAAYIFVENGTGNNAIIVCPGAAGRISAEDVEAARGLIERAGVFVTQLEQPMAAAERGLAIARGAGVTTILNPAPAAPLPDAMLALCDWVTPNETEAEALTGIAVDTVEAAAAAAGALMDRGAGGAVITLGERGALFRDRGRAFHVPVVSAGPVVETTGAGDAFTGGFAVALAEGMGPEDAVRFACATAGISVTRAGTAPSMPSRAEIAALLARTPREVRPWTG
jgi:ribokinase